jgi:hypothetical protein
MSSETYRSSPLASYRDPAPMKLAAFTLCSPRYRSSPSRSTRVPTPSKPPPLPAPLPATYVSSPRTSSRNPTPAQPPPFDPQSVGSAGSP